MSLINSVHQKDNAFRKAWAAARPRERKRWRVRPLEFRGVRGTLSATATSTSKQQHLLTVTATPSVPIMATLFGLVGEVLLCTAEAVAMAACAAVAGLRSAGSGIATGSVALVCLETGGLSLWAVGKVVRSGLEIVGCAAGALASLAWMLEDLAVERCQAAFAAEQAALTVLEASHELRSAASSVLGLSSPEPYVRPVPIGLPVTDGERPSDDWQKPEAARCAAALSRRQDSWQELGPRAMPNNPPHSFGTVVVP